MHCKVCNTELTDFESTRKDANTFQYLDMCNLCISAAGVPTIDRLDLISEDDIDDLDMGVYID